MWVECGALSVHVSRESHENERAREWNEVRARNVHATLVSVVLAARAAQPLVSRPQATGSRLAAWGFLWDLCDRRPALKPGETPHLR